MDKWPSPVLFGEMLIFIAMKFNKSFPIVLIQPRLYLELLIVIQLHNKYYVVSNKCIHSITGFFITSYNIFYTCLLTSAVRPPVY